MFSRAVQYLTWESGTSRVIYTPDGFQGRVRLSEDWNFSVGTPDRFEAFNDITHAGARSN